MAPKRNHHCYYVDHTFFSAREIGKIYSKLSQLYSDEDLGDSIILATCQRIEVYTFIGQNPLASLGLPFKHISGRENLKKRLVAIGVGVESQILGEKNVFYQVKNAFRDVDDKNEMKSVFAEALDEAYAIRKEKGFYADMNYEDISLAILQSALNEVESTNIGLVIVGSGMLARNFLGKDILSQYNDVKFITRSPKNLKKKFEKGLKKNVLRCEEFCSCEHNFYHCIIATNGLERNNYADGIRPILQADACQAIFDLSAVPLFQREVGEVFYADTYSDSYFRHVDTYNDRIRAEVQSIKDEILNGVSIPV